MILRREAIERRRKTQAASKGTVHPFRDLLVIGHVRRAARAVEEMKRPRIAALRRVAQHRQDWRQAGSDRAQQHSTVALTQVARTERSAHLNRRAFRKRVELAGKRPAFDPLDDELKLM